MSGAFFAQNWYRVAGLRPRILGHIRVERHRYGRQAWYALHDTLAGRVHRVTPAAYLFVVRMDGRATVDEIWQGLVAEMDTDAPGQDTVVQLLMQLHGADLLAGDTPPDAAELLSRRDRLSRQLLVRNMRSPMSMQIPLIDPDRFLARCLPIAAPLMTWIGLVAWCVLVAAGALTAARHWDELSENVLDRVLAGEGLLALALCYPVVKVLHELGHGFAAKRLGCEVREMGVMLLVGFPVPYVDASASAALRSKWQRAGVAAAGIIVELTLAAVAALVWASAEPGLLRAVAFNVMLIGGASTLVVNGNPLLRFDGYYVLSDLLEVPNLGQRSQRYLGHLMNRYAFGLRAMRDFMASRYERIVMLAYAPLSWVYRAVVTIGIAQFIATHYFVVGVVLAAVTVSVALAWPMAKSLWRIATAPQYRARRWRAGGITFGGIAAAAALLLAVPAPVHSTAEGVIWLPEDAFVRAGADGFVRTIAAVPGEAVAPGQVLFTLDHPIQEARMHVSAARVDELTAKYNAEWVTDRIAARATSFELGQEQATLARERVRIGRHAVTALAAGTFQPARPEDDLPGRFVHEGDVLGYVTPVSGEVARVLVPQADIGLVRDRLVRVAIRLADRRTDLASSVVRAVPAAGDQLPSQALASANGGATTADPRDTKTLRAFERQFQFDIILPDPALVASAGFGSRVFVRFDYAWEPIGKTILRRVRQGMLSRFGA